MNKQQKVMNCGWLPIMRSRQETIRQIIIELETFYCMGIEINMNWHFFYCVRPSPSYDYVLHEQEGTE